MDIIETKDATTLRADEWILTSPSVASRVTRESDPEQHGCVTIHTEAGAILASLPCPVKVVDPTTLTDDEKGNVARETAAATARIRQHLDDGGVSERLLLEWIAEHSTDPVARELVDRLFENLEQE